MTLDASTVVRKSLPLTPRDLEVLARFRETDAYHAALNELCSFTVTPQTSEASFLHAVLAAGIRAIENQVEESGYREMAAQMDASPRKKVARRRQPAWASE